MCASKLAITVGAIDSDIYIYGRSDAKWPDVVGPHTIGVLAGTSVVPLTGESNAAMFDIESPFTLYTVARIDASSELPKRSAAASASWQKARDDLLAKLWDTTYYSVWATLCPEDVINLAFHVGSQKPKTMSIGPWTAARLVPATGEPMLVRVTGAAQAVSATQFEVGLDGLAHTLVVRDFGTTKLLDSARAMGHWRASAKQIAPSFSPSRLAKALAPTEPPAEPPEDAEDFGQFADDILEAAGAADDTAAYGYVLPTIPQSLLTSAQDAFAETSSDLADDGLMLRLGWPEYVATKNLDDVPDLGLVSIWNRTMARVMTVAMVMAPEKLPDNWTTGVFGSSAAVASLQSSSSALVAAQGHREWHNRVSLSLGSSEPLSELGSVPDNGALVAVFALSSRAFALDDFEALALSAAIRMVSEVGRIDPCALMSAVFTSKLKTAKSKKRKRSDDDDASEKKEPEKKASRSGNFSTLKYAWDLIKDFPQVQEASEDIKKNKMRSIASSMRGYRFAKPMERGGKRGGNNRRPEDKLVHLMRELEDAAECGVGSEEMLEIIQATGVFYTVSRA